MSEDGSKLMGALKAAGGAAGEGGQLVGFEITTGSGQATGAAQPNNAIAQAMAAAEQDTEAEATGGGTTQQLVIHAADGGEVTSEQVAAAGGQFLVTTTLHVCAICGKAYTQKDGLDEHMQTHASRLYSCSLCGAIFIDKSHLDVHMRSHYAQQGTILNDYVHTCKDWYNSLK